MLIEVACSLLFLLFGVCGLSCGVSCKLCVAIVFCVLLFLVGYCCLRSLFLFGLLCGSLLRLLCCCSLFVDRCLLFVVCCSLHVGCYGLLVVCCLLCVVCRLFVVWCDVRCCPLLLARCSLLCVAMCRCLLFVDHCSVFLDIWLLFVACLLWLFVVC